MIEQALQPRRRPLALADVAGSIDRDPGSGGTEQKEEERGERVKAQMEGQIGQADRQDKNLRAGIDAAQGENRKCQTADGTERKKHTADQHETVLEKHTDEANQQPDQRRGQYPVDEQEFAHFWLGKLCLCFHNGGSRCPLP